MFETIERKTEQRISDLSRTRPNDNKADKKRTELQNNALHKYFQQVADALNSQGYDVRVILEFIAKRGIDMMWSRETVKELLWRPIQKKHLAKHSTTELNSTKDINEIYDMLNKFLSENFQTFVPFPSLQTLIDNQPTKKD